MQAIAHARFARYSYRKVGQVLKLIRGKTASQALEILPFVPRICRILVEKTVKSAVANAGKGTDPTRLRIIQAWANHAAMMKRVRPRAMGGRAMYKRKTCHLTIAVSDEAPARIS